MHVGGREKGHAFSCKWGNVGGEKTWFGDEGFHKCARMGKHGASEKERDI